MISYELAKQLKAKRDRKRYLKHRKEVIAKSTQWQKDNREKSLQHKRNSNRKLRKMALDNYGRVCQCCGEEEEKFLSIDHVNGGGGKHRKEIGSSHIYSWLKKNNYPANFQTLCHNCNMAKGFYKICPHQE